jgi:hypothetical protein
MARKIKSAGCFPRSDQPEKLIQWQWRKENNKQDEEK